MSIREGVKMLRKNGRWNLFFTASLLLFSINGCATKTQTGALTGAAIGGISGAMLGNSKTAAVGAAAGAVTGAIIGKQLDNREGR
jgi:outer membrane lipoprotein SlyB